MQLKKAVFKARLQLSAASFLVFMLFLFAFVKTISLFFCIVLSGADFSG